MSHRTRLARLEERHDALAHRVTERIRTDEAALKAADIKLDAHLLVLNNATERAETVARTVVSRDRYEADQKRILVQMAAIAGGAGVVAYFLSLFLPLHKAAP